MLTSLAALVGSVGIALGAPMGATPAEAATIPWTCDPFAYLFQSPSGQNVKPHTVQKVDLATGAYSQIGTTSGALNGLGYNTLDNYIYGWDSTTSQLVRVNADMTLQQLGLPTGFPNTAYNVGDFDLAGHLWIANGNATPPLWREVDFAPGSSTFGQVIGSGTMVQPAGLMLPSDWSYIAGPGPVGFYGAGETVSGTGNAHLFRFDPASGTMNDLGAVPGLPSSSAYGASYSDANGYLYVSNNATGVIYRIDPVARTQIALSNGPKAVYSDGARCLLAGTPTITLNKSVAGRLQPSDQFTVSLADSAGTVLTSATTTGTQTSTGTVNWPVSNGSTYQLSDALAAGSGSTLGAYATSIVCQDSATGANVPVGGSSPTWTLPVTSNDGYVCTITNSPNAQPGISLVKAASPSGSATYVVGELITYSYVVTNTGNVPLTGVTVAETPGAFTGSGTMSPIQCPSPANLDPGAQLTCTATYTLTQQDIDNGTVSNTATATGTPPTGPPITSPPSTVVIPADAAPSLTVRKSADPTTVTTAGQTVTYTYVVTNTGNVTLTGVGITDDPTAFTGSGSISAVACPPSRAATLPPGASMTCTASYTVTQTDIDHGGFTNTATAHGEYPAGTTVQSGPDSAAVTATQSPALTIAKTADPTTVTTAGSTVTYTFVITNTGNTTLTDVAPTETQSNRQGPLSVITCPADAASVPPGASVTCTATYQVTAADLTQQSLTDTAVANGTGPGGSAVTSPPSSAVVGVRTASLTLEKSVDPAVVQNAGAVVTYSFVVNNTGTATLTGVNVTETAFSGSGGAPTITCPTDTLAGGSSMTCTATYTVTAADIASGQITNRAVATGTAPDGPSVTSPPADAVVTVTAAPAPSLSILKSADPTSVQNVGQQITYSFLVTNDGNVPLTGVSVQDTAFSGAGGPLTITCPSADLAVGASMVCTATYTVTLADIDAGQITNAAVATGTPPTGPPVTSPPSTATVTVTPAPALTVVKTAVPSTVQNAGDQVTYHLGVTNTGNDTVHGISVQDTAFTGTGVPPTVSCPDTVLAPGASTTCTATYTVTQADIDAGQITNTAVATGLAPDGSAVTSPPSTATVTATPAPALTVVKTAAPSTVQNAGQQVTYSYLVTNTGNDTVHGISVQDTAFTGTGVPPTVSCPDTVLAPGASTTCTATYTVTQADIDAGQITNTAHASGTAPDGSAVASPPSTATVTVTPAPALTVVKTAVPSTVQNAGDQVTYSFVVTNTGNDTVHGISVQDTAFTGTGTPSAISCPVTTLAPGESTTCTATYTVTLADIDAGQIINTAVATGLAPDGSAVTSPPSTATVTATPAPALTVVKTAAPSTVQNAGDQVTYRFVVTNTGNDTVHGISVQDTAFSGSGGAPTVNCPVTTLAPGESTTCTATYTVTAADIASGRITNTAVATGTASDGSAVTSPPSSADVTVTVAPVPSLSVVKSANPTTARAAGQTITYTFRVTNTGNVTLNGVTVQDTAFSGSGGAPTITCPETTLAPGAFMDCTAVYTVTQADIDSGQITNTAVATGTPPTGPAVTSPPSEVTVPAQRNNALRVAKTATPTSVSTAGQVVTYDFVVTNDGNTTVSGITVRDTAFSGSGGAPTVNCPSTSLAPGVSMTCTATYTVTAADIAGGRITNTAVASGTGPDGATVTSPPSSADVTVPVVPAPALSVAKTASPSTVRSAGQVVTYTFQVTNTGNVPVHGIVVRDTAFSGSGGAPTVNCPSTSLAPGASVTCTATYTVTQADIDSGQITNTAVATGDAPDGSTVTSPPSSATVTAERTASLSVVKTADPSVVQTAGQVVTYSFRVTNTGNVPIDGISVRDTAFSGSGGAPTVNCPSTSLAPGASVTCTATYTVTAEDIASGRITNTAVASGTGPDGSTVTSPPASATVTVSAAQQLTLEKDGTLKDDVILYTFTVGNPTDQTVTDIVVNDPTVGPVSCPSTTLAPGASMTCTATYKVTDADRKAGFVENTATATGQTPNGPVTSPPASTCIPVPPCPEPGDGWRKAAPGVIDRNRKALMLAS